MLVLGGCGGDEHREDTGPWVSTQSDGEVVSVRRGLSSILSCSPLPFPHSLKFFLPLSFPFTFVFLTYPFFPPITLLFSCFFLSPPFSLPHPSIFVLAAILCFSCEDHSSLWHQTGFPKECSTKHQVHEIFYGKLKKMERWGGGQSWICSSIANMSPPKASAPPLALIRSEKSCCEETGLTWFTPLFP